MTKTFFFYLSLAICIVFLPASASAGAVLQFLEYGQTNPENVGQVKNFYLLRNNTSVQSLVIHSTDGTKRCIQSLANLSDVNAKALIDNLRSAQSITCVGRKKADNVNILETTFLELGYSR